MGRLRRILYAVRTWGDATGTANAAVTTTNVNPGTLTDTRRGVTLDAFIPNALIGAYITCNAKTGTIASNTEDSITLETSWAGGDPGQGNAYVIGGAGVSSGLAIIPVPGGVARFMGINLDYAGTAPATTDVNVTSKDPSGAAKQLLKRDNNATDISWREIVEVPYKDGNGGAPTASTITEVNPIVVGTVRVKVEQSNDLNPAVSGAAVFEVF